MTGTPRSLRHAVHLLLATWLSTAWLLPGEARACSEPVCQNGFLVPSGAARVPENAPGLLWRAVRDGSTNAEDEVTVVRTRGATESDAGTTVDVTRTPLVPADGHAGDAGALGVLLGFPLVAGEHLRVAAADTCVIGGQRPFVAELEVTPARPLPTRLGTLRAEPLQHAPLTVANDGGGCSREADAVYVDVALTLHDEAAPWADLLLYETHVDGARYFPASSTIHTPAPHESWVGRGRDRLALLCDATASDASLLSPGEHRVQLVARLAGTDLLVRSEPLLVTLQCPAGSVTSPADTLYDAVSYQTGALVIAGQLALLLYIVLTRKRRKRGAARRAR